MQDRDSELLRRASRGDNAAFRELVDAHASHLFGVAYALLGNTGDAEDVVQNTLLAALRGLTRFRGEASVRTWLVAILTRQAALWRRKRGRSRGPTAVEDLPSRSEPFGRTVDARLDVAQVLAMLTPEHREVIVLREFEGMSYDEIASMLYLGRKQVATLIFRAKKELRRLLSDGK